MKILFVTNYYPPHEVGGYEQLCRDVAQGLLRRGNDIRVLTSDYQVRDGRPEAGSYVRRCLRLQLDYRRAISPALQFFLLRPLARVHNLRCLRSAYHAFSPDAVLIWNLDGLHRSIALEAEALGAAVAYWLAGRSPAERDEYWDYWNLDPKSRTHLGPIKSFLRRIALQVMVQEGHPVRPEMRHVAVVSEYLRRTGISQGVLPKHATVIYNGVELDRFLGPVPARVDGPLRMLQAGRVSANKGVHTSLEAVAQLLDSHPDERVQLSIAGSGTPQYLERLCRFVESHGIERSVSFLGWLPRERIARLMADHHVLLLPTVHQEPFARVVLEAMASGLVVVAAETGGTTEIVTNGVTGLTFPPGESSQLARQIVRLLREPSLRFQLALEGQRLVRQAFTLERMVDSIERLLWQSTQA